jgi:DNA-binding GntR family transcriptional regulator
MAAESARLFASVETEVGRVRPGSTEDVAMFIRQLIFNGDLRPGQRVTQADITRCLGVSHIPLRGALIDLERAGWITIENYRGAFVNALDPNMIHDHFDVSGLIYEFAIHLAMKRSGSEFVEAITSLQSDLAQTTDGDKAAEYVVRFYGIIGDYAKSCRLLVVRRAIFSSLSPGSALKESPAAVDHQRRSIAKVVRAVRRNDTDEAGAEIRRALQESSREVIRLFRDRGLFDLPTTSSTSPPRARH